MPAAITDLLTNAASTTTARPQPTQVTSARTGGGVTLQCNALVGWPTDTAVHFISYKVSTAGVKTPGSQIDMKGIVSGTNITNIVIRGGSDVGNAVGDIVEMAPTAAWAYDLESWGTVHADASGNLLTAAVQAALGLSNLSGYTPLGAIPNTVVSNGNRSYDVTFNSTDLTGIVSNGMRLRFTRTVTAPTQCTSLNGTTQYYSKTAPNGMTFVDDFATGVFVKLSSYAAGNIISRYNGTSGWALNMLASGQVYLTAWNAGAINYSQVGTYQSLPLNKWVHVLAQIDMSAFTASPTTSYIMLDGVDTSVSVSRGGTNPISLIQAGNLEIGSQNGGTLPFAGKIAQAFVTSAKLTQTQVKAIYSQGITTADTTTYNMVSAFSFNNSINDLNVTNANNLTANGGSVATNADSFCTQDDTGTPSGTNDFVIVTKKVFATNTTLTVQVPEGCTIPTSGGVSAVVYSSNKAPFGFPNTPTRWRLVCIQRVDAATTSTGTFTPYNSGGLVLVMPVGQWSGIGVTAGSAYSLSTSDMVFALHTSAISGLTRTAGSLITRRMFRILSPSAAAMVNSAYISQPEDIASSSTYTLYSQGATTSAGLDGANGTLEVFAEFAL